MYNGANMIQFATLFALVSPKLGDDLSIVNSTEDAAYVYVDGEFLGRVASGKGKVFESSPGRHRVSLMSQDGELLQRERLRTADGEMATVVLHPPHGILELQNDSGTALRITVDGEYLAEVQDGESVSQRVSPGRHRVRAFYRVKGSSVLLSRQDTRILDGAEQSLNLQPASSGWIHVSNTLNKRAELRVDGVRHGRLRAGESILIEAPLGHVELGLTDLKGRVIAEETVEVEPYRASSFFSGGHGAVVMAD
jgi:hypothetical protein